MYLVRVIPLAKLPAQAPSVLDYFWPDAVLSGCLVTVPMARRNVRAVVIGCTDVRTSKLAVKKAAFTLRKLTSVIAAAPQLTVHQRALVGWLAAHYACSPATALTTVAPAFIGTRSGIMDHATVPSPHGRSAGQTLYRTQPDTFIALARTTMKTADGQVLVLVPEQSLAHTLAGTLGAVHFHSNMPAKGQRELYRGVLDGSVRHVVGTRAALFLPWSDLSTVIVEDPLSDLYKNDGAPRYHAADVARQLATLHSAALLWCTPALSAVQHHLISSDSLSYHDLKPHWPDIVLTSARSEAESGHRALFSRRAEDALLDAYEQRVPVLIYSARRAYASIARCTACRAPVPCESCSVPLRWHRTTEDMLVCYHCTAYRAVPSRCPHCTMGMLRPSGLPGSQKLAETVSSLLDRYGHAGIRIPILDSDLVRSPEDSREVMEGFAGMEHPILVATAMISAYRYTLRFPLIIVPSADALLTNPDYRSGERFIIQLEKLADFGPSTMVIQSFDEDGLAALAPSRAWDRYLSDELPHRKSLFWPPYARIVLLTYRHRDRSAATRAALACADTLKRASTQRGIAGVRVVGPSPSLIERAGDRWTQRIVIKCSGPVTRMQELLSFVPPDWIVDVDPRSIA